MAPPNALSIVKSEVSLLLTSMKCSPRSTFRSTQDEAKRALLNGLDSVRRKLNEVADLDSTDPLTYITPFLDVIRSEKTNGNITEVALSSVEKFLAYGLLEVRPGSPHASENTIGIAMETIAEAVIQARFIRSGSGSDEVVLMKIVHILRTLLLIPSGCLLSNQMVHEILQNCLRICLESQLSELLRRTAEHFLASIVQLFFSRLPTLLILANEDGLRAQDEKKHPEVSGRRLTVTNEMEAAAVGATSTGDKVESPSAVEERTKVEGSSEGNVPRRDESICSLGDHLVATDLSKEAPEVLQSPPNDGSESPVTFAVEIGQEADEDTSTDVASEQLCRPYDLQAVNNLFSLLVSLLNPEEHQEPVIKVALGLLTVALETGVDFLHACPVILNLVATDMTKYLMMLLYRDRISVFAATLRVAFLLFEALRLHLKLQVEVYFQRLIALINSESERISYEQREMALDAAVQLFLLPGLAAEVYVNYDCDPYCSNLFEDLVETLTKNAYPLANRVLGTNLIALNALLALVEAIDVQTGELTSSSPEEKVVEEGEEKPQLMRTSSDQRNRSLPRPNRHWLPSSNIPTQEHLVASKDRKKTLLNGSDRFNLKPKDGIAFLQKHGVLSDPLDPVEVAAFLAENPRLDKKTIGEYLSNRKNSDILVAFVRHFNFSGTRIDEALRAYLEAFRIPGEAPLIQHLMESFAEQWFEANNAPFANVDAAFTLAYAILMLNTDQHNPNSRRQNVPMTCADFRRNLKGMNGGGEFEASLVEAIYESIHNREIVMPSEQTGAVRDNYLWKCLVRRSSQATFVHYMHLPPGAFDKDLFGMLWGPTVAALSCLLEKSVDLELTSRTMMGFVRCARIAAHFRMTKVFDNLIISICKFTMLLNQSESPESVGIALGRSPKAQLATRLVFALAAAHGDMLRDGWKSLLLECLLRLLHANLLPSNLVQSPLFVASQLPSASATSYNTRGSNEHLNDGGSGAGGGRQDLGVLGSFYQYLTHGSTTSNLARSGTTDPVAAAFDRPQPTDDLEATNLELDDSFPPPSQPRGGFLSATDLFQLISQAPASPPQSDDDSAAFQTARSTVATCQIGALFEETKFLMLEALQDLIKALLYGLTNASLEGGIGGGERSQVFCLELLLQVLLYNRDRIEELWPMVCGHFVDILRGAREPSFLVECVVAGMLRLAFRLLRRQQDLATQIFACLLTILQERGAYLLRPLVSQQMGGGRRGVNPRYRPGEGEQIVPSVLVGVSSVARQVVCGVAALLGDSGGAVAIEVPSARDWQLIMGLLEVCGAGAFPITREELEAAGGNPRGVRSWQQQQQVQEKKQMYSSLQNVAADSQGGSPAPEGSRDYSSDNESTPVDEPRRLRPAVESWVLVNVVDKSERSVEKPPETAAATTTAPSLMVPSSRLRLPIVVVFQDWFALEKASDSLAFVVRDPAHITPNNIEFCVHTLRVFIEAVLTPPKPSIIRKTSSIGSGISGSPMERVSPLVFELPEVQPQDSFTSGIALQLLDLVYILFSRAPSIYAEWTKPIEDEGNAADADVDEKPRTPASTTATTVDESVKCLWPACWRALLQAIARLCIDARREVRSDALAVLQRALLSPLLHLLSGQQWLDCFNEVLFPLLTNFLESVSSDESSRSLTAGGGGASGGGSASNSNRNASTHPGGGGASSTNPSNAGGGFFSNIFGVGSTSSSTGGGVESLSTASGAGGGVLMTGAALAEYTDPRMRVIPLITKVFLQHLSPLYALEEADFCLLWSRLLTYMERYIRTNISDSLNDAVRESLKNLLLVLYTGTQDTPPILVCGAAEGTRQAALWSRTQAQLDRFMPTLMDQLFPPPPPSPKTVEEAHPESPEAPGESPVTPTVTTTTSDVPPTQEQQERHQGVVEKPQMTVGEFRIQLPVEESDNEGQHA